MQKKNVLGRFRRKALNLGREAYKGTSSPKFDGKKSPYQMENFEEKPIPVSFSDPLESGTFFLFLRAFFLFPRAFLVPSNVTAQK